jgi:hypothetical protein
MKKHVYEYDEVVVGSGLSAIFYSYINQLPLIFKEENPPQFYEHFEADFPLDGLFLTNPPGTLNTPQGQIKVGTSKLQMYDRLLFVLSVAGKIPISDKIEKIRSEGNTLKIATQRARSIKIKFNKLRVFDPELIQNLNRLSSQKKKCLVQDKFRVVMEEHDYDLIRVNDDFVSEIRFYANEVIKKRKEIVVTSFLTDDDLLKFDYSLIPMKYKLRSIFENLGLKKRVYEQEIVLDYINREVYNRDTSEYEEVENIVFDFRTEKEICLNTLQHMHHQTRLTLLDVYPWRLNHLLLDSSGMIR